MSYITDSEIEHFIDVHFRERNEEIKSIVKNIKKQEMLSWVKIMFSPEFREKFPSKKAVQKLNEKERKIFEELFIMIPLNYIYWRDCLKHEQLFPTTDQKRNPICWAHAIASLIHLTLRRIISRNPPAFEEIKNDLVNEFGCHGMFISPVLDKVLKYPKYNILHYQEVKEEELNVFNPYGSYHLYIAGFYLTGEEWNDFSNFFADPKNKKKVLTRKDLQITQPDEKYKKEAGGHEVVLIDHDSTSLTFLNSWGKDWGDEGKFTIERGAIKMEYHDIFWYDCDLSNEERLCFENRRQNAIEAFYQILEYTSLLSTIEKDDENDAIRSVKERQKSEVEIDTKKILKEFSEDFWKPGQETVFRNRYIFTNISINDYNNMTLIGQLGVSEKMIDLTTGKIRDFFIKIKNFLEFIKEKNISEKQCIRIKRNKNEILKDIKEERRVAFSTYLNDNIYQFHLLEDQKLIDLMKEFEFFHVDLKYPDSSFQKAYDNIIYTNIFIKLTIKGNQRPNKRFHKCQNLYFISFDQSVTEIFGAENDPKNENGPFSFCEQLSKVLISTSVTKIDDTAFKGCKSLKEISIPFSVTQIGNSVFRGCTSLTKISISSFISHIDDNIFDECSSINETLVPSYITQIGDYVFCECSSLNQISIPFSVT